MVRSVLCAQHNKKKHVEHKWEMYGVHTNYMYMEASYMYLYITDTMHNTTEF